MEHHHPIAKAVEQVKKQRRIPSVSAVFDDGTILEIVYRPEEKRTAFVVWKDGEWRIEESYTPSPFERLVPYSPRNNLIRNEVVLFPSEPEEYGSEAELIGEVRTFVHRYVDVSPLFEQIASYYVLLSWVYDGFDALPYLRVRGEPGSGKTRFLLIVGALCYKPLFASGASTVSPLFRILDSFRGTLVIDESDFRLSDERAEIVKILNNGHARGFPVLRSEAVGQREFNPRAYQVYGPKLVATRGFFDDKALESRFLTEEMDQTGLREEIPINLPPAYKEEALHLRNKLLLFRFRSLGKARVLDELVDRAIEPRLNQIFVPLLSLIEEPEARRDLQALARSYHEDLIADRGLDAEARILEIIRELLGASPDARLSIKEIASWFADRYGNEYERRITTKWVGTIVRKKLHLKTQKRHGVYVIPPAEWPKLEGLYAKYGVTAEEPEPNPEAAPLEIRYEPLG
ncbi:MAG: hypothetical protein HYS14_11105 [Candidatus Rokubacteria bacterium]|nr:hypothetical protein [Candidatus Rokubacteria bacterium]